MRLRGSLAYAAWAILCGLVSSLRPARCCACRLERDEALMELARLRLERDETEAMVAQLLARSRGS